MPRIKAENQKEFDIKTIKNKIKQLQMRRDMHRLKLEAIKIRYSSRLTTIKNCNTDIIKLKVELKELVGG